MNDAGGLMLGLVLALMMLAVALSLTLDDFRRVLERPRYVLAGFLTQFGLLPGLTLILTLLLPLPANIETAMLLVAACPGGNLSNFLAHLSRGNAALSVSLTAVASLAAIVMMPVNFAWTVALNPATREWVRNVDVEASGIVFSVLFILALPLAVGLWLNTTMPRKAAVVRDPLARFGMVALGLFIVFIAVDQWALFRIYLLTMLPLVIFHNAMALGAGNLAARVVRAGDADRRALTIEVGMQNSALALGITVTQFNADPGMVAICSMWGAWHIVSGMGLARFWSRRPPRPVVAGETT